MKILILTQIVDKNDSVLGFFHDWLMEFSKKFDSVTVICLKKGEYDLPKNVKVFSLGKEKGVSKIVYLINFYKYIVSLRKDYDCVFVHMTQMYVLLGSILWKIFNKRIYLWYAHGKVSFSLKCANFFVNKVFTSTNEGYRIDTDKKIIVGQGINIEKFKKTIKIKNNNFVTTGRISKVKNIDFLIKIFNELPNINLNIIGEAITNEDIQYLNECKKNAKSNIYFLGPIKNENINNVYLNCSFFVSASQTGSMDKVILEAMSSGLIPITINEAFCSAFKQIGIENLYMTGLDMQKYTNLILELDKLTEFDYNNISNKVSEYVDSNHSVQSLIEKFRNEIIYKN